MNTVEKIEALASFLLKLKEARPDFGYVAFEDIKDVIDVPKVEAQQICELLKKKGFIAFEYMPFDDRERVFITFDSGRVSDYLDPHGAMRFFSIRDEESSLPAEMGGVNLSRLEEIVDSESLRDELAKDLRPEIRYNSKTAELMSDGRNVSLGSHNSRVIAEKIFSQPFGTRIPEEDIAFKLDDTKIDGEFKKGDTAGYTYLYNSINRVNDKIEELTGIHRLIQYKRGKIWIE